MKNLQQHQEQIRQSNLDRAFRMIDATKNTTNEDPELVKRDREDMIKKLIKGRV